MNRPGLRVSNRLVVALAGVLFVAIFALRLGVGDPAEPVMFLMVVPIGLLAAETGVVGGAAGALLASALVVAWSVLNAPDLSPFGFSVRFGVFFATGVSVGWLVRSRQALEGESHRWFEQSADLNCVADLDGNFVRVNDAFERTLGYKQADLMNKPYLSFVHPDDLEKTIELATRLAEGQVDQGGFENRYRAADGSYRWLRWTSTTDETRGVIYATARDVTQTKELEDQLRDLAQTDPLTGLNNRRHFETEATRQLDFLRRYGPGGALFVFDIDGFKAINDSFGHRAGDEALKGVASAIKTGHRSTDICGRLGGDEFAILFPGVSPREAEDLARKLLASIEQQSPTDHRGSSTITSSIGVAVFDQSEIETLGTLVARADEAMYSAKQAGGNRYSFATTPQTRS